MAVRLSISLSLTNGDKMKKTVIMVSCLSLFLLLSGHVSAGNKAKPAKRDPWALSYQLEAKKQYAQALDLITPLRTTPPNMQLAVMRTAWLQYLLANYNDSIRDYSLAIRLNTVSIDARLGITLPLMAQQRWREVTTQLKMVLALSPWNYTAHLRLLQAEEAQRHWDAMGKHAAKLSKRYPSDATALVYMARASAWQAKIKQARAAYTQVLARIPNHIEATHYLKNN